MRAEPKLRKLTRDKHVKRAVVTRGQTTLASLRDEISETRRAQVYRTDVEFTGEAGDPKRDKISDEVLAEVHELRLGGVKWRDIAERYNRSVTGITQAYLRYVRGDGDRE